MGDPGGPKAKVTLEQDNFQVELQMMDYTPEEVEIRTEGDVLVVMACQGSTQGPVSKQFEQRFSLPSGVTPNKISSYLNKEGLLTITAPRDNQPVISALKKASGGQEPQDWDDLPHPKVSYDEEQFEISMNTKHYKPEELGLKVEGNTIIITAKQEVPEAGGVRTRVFEQKFSLPNGVRADAVASNLSREGVLTITAPRGNPTAAESYMQTIENKMDKVMNPNTWEDETEHKRESEGSSARKRESGKNEEGAIARIEYDEDTYRILINVAQYRPEELVVKTASNTIHVTASHQEKGLDGRKLSTKSFSQSFSLPHGVNPDSVTSVLSRNGVLTISAPLPLSFRVLNNDSHRPA